MTPWLAVLAPHRVRLHRGGEVTEEVETVLSLSGPDLARDGDTGLNIGLNGAAAPGLTVSGGLVRHPAGHTDPAIHFTHDARAWLQLFLHACPPDQAPTEVQIGDATLIPQWRESGRDGIALETTLTADAGSLRVVCAHATEVWLHTRPLGASAVTETLLTTLDPGQHRLDLGTALPASPPPYLGLIVTVRDALFGGVEHKYRLIGDLTLGSGLAAADDQGFGGPWTVDHQALTPCVPARRVTAGDILQLAADPAHGAWLQAPHPSLARPASSAGIAHSLWQEDGQDPRRRRLRAARRDITPGHPCQGCAVRRCCDQILPQPATPADVADLFGDGECRLAALIQAAHR